MENKLKYQYHLLTWGGFYNNEHKEKHGFNEGDYVFDTEKERSEHIEKLKEAELLYPEAKMLAISTSEGYNCNIRTTLHRVVEYEGKEYYSNYDMGINYRYSAAKYHMEYKWYPGFNDYPLGEDFNYNKLDEYQIKQEWVTGAFSDLNE